MVRFGILGAGNIAHRFAASLAHEPRATLVAASCRTQEKAEAFLTEVPCATDAHAYGSHEAMLKDPAVDAIYLALPHHLHCEWALRAFAAGKAVLCEKPAMLNKEQMREVASAAQQAHVLFMEAMKPRFTSLYEQLPAAIDRIGPIERVEATLCNDMLGLVEGTGTYHMTPGPGAGVLLDCGTYCASWIEDFCPGEVVLVRADGVRKDGIDVYANAELRCGEITARLECAFDRAKPRTATIVGAHGRIVVDELHRPQHATVSCDGAKPRAIDAPHEVDDFFGEIRHFVSLMEEGKTESPVMSLAASERTAEVLDVIGAAL